MAGRGRGKRAERAQRVLGERWDGSMQDVFLGLREWRALHPKATLAEIETELDRRMARVRAQMLADLALASGATDVQAEDPPGCPQCGGRLRDEGVHARTLVTLNNEAVTLERDYATCSQCGSRVFPPRR
jgi:DNA-directed RNA polymerase subunit RPC12/RpoP